MIKEIVEKENTFDKLEIRLGKILQVEEALSSQKKAYKLTVDFGKFGVKTSIGRFTQHKKEDIIGKFVVGVLNFAPRYVGEQLSEVLILGVQYPRADSGEATFITSLAEAKIGSKLF